ncbi:MAG: hypothetical protein ACKPKO_35070, partial [Candidatus Fonsibacter sp.]
MGLISAGGNISSGGNITTSTGTITGKSGSFQNMILEIYKNCFERIYIFSPSIYVASSWLFVKKYIEKEMKVQNTDEEPIYF